MLAPITEEDKPALETLIKKLMRMRKREHAQGSKPIELDEAITGLCEYGYYKGWFADPDPIKWNF